MIRQPAPDIRRDHAHHRLDRHQHRNLDGIEMDGFEIQAPVGSEHPHESVVEEVESGDAPVVIFMRIQIELITRFAAFYNRQSFIANH